MEEYTELGLIARLSATIRYVVCISSLFVEILVSLVFLLVLFLTELIYVNSWMLTESSFSLSSQIFVYENNIYTPNNYGFLRLISENYEEN